MLPVVTSVITPGSIWRPVAAWSAVRRDRGALLIVRDLLFGLRRYCELQTGGIVTDVLAARLRTLQGQGFVRKVIPPRVPLTSMLAGATAIPRQADGRYEVRLGDEAIRVDVIGGQVHAAQTASRTPPSS